MVKRRSIGERRRKKGTESKNEKKRGKKGFCRGRKKKKMKRYFTLEIDRCRDPFVFVQPSTTSTAIV